MAVPVSFAAVASSEVPTNNFPLKPPPILACNAPYSTSVLQKKKTFGVCLPEGINEGHV